MFPKPAIDRIVSTWTVEPGMEFALVIDVDRRVWIRQSCPVGTHFWTVGQAAELAFGIGAGAALLEAIRAGQRLEASRRSGSTHRQPTRVTQNAPRLGRAASARNAQSADFARRRQQTGKPLVTV